MEEGSCFKVVRKCLLELSFKIGNAESLPSRETFFYRDFLILILNISNAFLQNKIMKNPFLGLGYKFNNGVEFNRISRKWRVSITLR